MSTAFKLELTPAQKRQLIRSLRNDWMDNDAQSCALIDKILVKLGAKS